MTPSPFIDSVVQEALRWLADHTPPKRPRAFGFTLHEVPGPMKTFKVTLTLPTLAAPNDVAKREITTTVDGVAQPAVDVLPADATSEIGTFNLGQVLAVSLVDIDDSGNRSTPREESLTVSDTVAPAEPGEFTFAVEEVIS